jgi:deoxyribose-phosphate aldolase
MVSDWRNAAKLIDHTLLKPDAAPKDMIGLCADAVQYGFFSVMVNPANVALAATHVHGTPVKVGTVVGFPLGANLTSTKLAEAEAVLRHGAQELDMVMNIGALKSGDRVLVRNEIRLLAQLAHADGAILKVILENALLTQEEKILACALSMDVGADFVKTSTGFTASGATAADVALMRGVVGHKVGVKAAGGIRTLAQFVEMVDAGANRIGASASVEIVRELGAAPDK